jgi:hypothetical protein
MGMFAWTSFLLLRDHIARRSSIDQIYSLPAHWNRTDMDIEGFVRAK